MKKIWAKKFVKLNANFNAKIDKGFYERLPIDMDGALHTDFTKSETSGDIKTIISHLFIIKNHLAPSTS